MNISYNWLKKYIAADLSAEAMATILTDIGLEVESFEKIETVRGGLQGVVVGEVLTCEKHPDSDHLHVTTVDVGAPEPLRIVCGAPNCRKGLKVLCATVGAVLYPEGGDEAFKIKRSKIRGVESLGMLCAEDELGIGASHDGIMELPADAPVGMPAKEWRATWRPICALRAMRRHGCCGPTCRRSRSTIMRWRSASRSKMPRPHPVTRE